MTKKDKKKKRKKNKPVISEKDVKEYIKQFKEYHEEIDAFIEDKTGMTLKELADIVGDLCYFFRCLWEAIWNLTKALVSASEL